MSGVWCPIRDADGSVCNRPAGHTAPCRFVDRYPASAPVDALREAAVTRFEVIDHRDHPAEPGGRVFSASRVVVELSYQDDGAHAQGVRHGSACRAGLRGWPVSGYPAEYAAVTCSGSARIAAQVRRTSRTRTPEAP